jgi:hypothetical protein
MTYRYMGMVDVPLFRDKYGLVGYQAAKYELVKPKLEPVDPADEGLYTVALYVEWCFLPALELDYDKQSQPIVRVIDLKGVETTLKWLPDCADAILDIVLERSGCRDKIPERRRLEVLAQMQTGDEAPDYGFHINTAAKCVECVVRGVGYRINYTSENDAQEMWEALRALGVGWLGKNELVDLHATMAGFATSWMTEVHAWTDDVEKDRPPPLLWKTYRCGDI